MNNEVRPNKREKIIASALSLFGRTHDVKKVSIESMAKAAGVSPTTIYNNFGNRETLVFEVIKVLIQKNLETNRQLVRSSLPFPQKIAAIISGKQDMLAQYHSELLENIMSQDDSIKPYVDKIFSQEIKPLWEAILREGKSQGYIEPDLDEKTLIIFLDVIKAGFSARHDLTKELTASPEMVRSLTRIMFYGFLKKQIALFKEG